MNQLLYYLLQVTAASGLLYGYYHLTLRNKKFHHYNRFYLLAAVLASIVIPFLNIPVYFSAAESDSSFVLQTLSVISSPATETGMPWVSGDKRAYSEWFTLSNILYTFYVVVAIVFYIKIIFSLKKINTLARNNPVEKLGKINFVNTDEPGTPFSFFRWMFWNRKIELHSEKGEQIFRHELFHIQQKHSWDIIFLEILTVIFWLNPFFHLAKKELKAIHEFLADEFAINKKEKWQYAELLLMQAFNTQTNLVNPFFHNQIKRRIAMITSSKKTNYQYLRKILVLPVAALVVVLFAFAYKNKSKIPVVKAHEQLTIVVDAGHGGTDPGAKSTDGKFTEAALSLAIAKTIQRLAPEYNVNVVMTREDENFPGGTTDRNAANRKRAAINNETKPDAFISIHLNSSPKNTANLFTGFEAYISKDRDTKEEKFLASSILNELESFYITRKVIQKNQTNGIWVLDEANYPAVLIQCGYINNIKDVAFVSEKSGQEKIARAILKGLVDFVNNKSPIIQQRDQSIIIKNKIDTIPPKKDSAFYVSPAKTQDSSKVLVVIDGKEKGVMSDFKKLDNLLDPNDIESISVLKGKSATDKYGVKGKNGVIEISTKKYIEKVDVKVVRRTDLKVRIREDDDNKIFEKVEIEATFPGGEKGWKSFLQKNLDPIVPVKNGAKSGTYTVVARFVVHKDGTISDLKTLTKHGLGLEEEVIRVMKLSPNWVPAIQNGIKVNAYKKQPITFVVSEG